MIRYLALFAFAVGLLTGCRTYGGYGSEAAIKQQMTEANRLFEEDLTRAHTGLQQLSQSPLAGAYPDFVASFQTLVDDHEAVLHDNQALAERVAGTDDYRDLHAAFGAILAKQQVVRDHYDDLYEQLAVRLDTSLAPKIELMSRYAYVPPFFERIATRNEEQRIMRTVRGQRTGTP